MELKHSSHKHTGCPTSDAAYTGGEREQENAPQLLCCQLFSSAERQEGVSTASLSRTVKSDEAQFRGTAHERSRRPHHPVTLAEATFRPTRAPHRAMWGVGFFHRKVTKITRRVGRARGASPPIQIFVDSFGPGTRLLLSQATSR